jgi:hypothetical protein
MRSTVFHTGIGPDKAHFETTYDGFTLGVSTEQNDRDNNEDYAVLFVTQNGVIIGAVCDGLGGHPNGELASSLVGCMLQEALETTELFEETFEEQVRTMLSPIRDALIAHGDTRDSTLLLAAVFSTGNIWLANVGDCTTAFQQGGKYKVTAIQGDGRSTVYHTMATLNLQYIGIYHWTFDPTQEFHLALMTDGCDTFSPAHAVLLRASELVTKASLLGRRGKRDNATAVTVQKLPIEASASVE